MTTKIGRHHYDEDGSWQRLDADYATTLLNTYNLEEFPSKRAALRGIVEYVLEAHGYDAVHVANLFTASPLVGEAKDQINPRATIAGLRDALSMNALWDIAIWGKSGIKRMERAIKYPHGCGVKASRSSTGYAFGENCDWIGLEESIRRCVEPFAATTTKTATHTKEETTMQIKVKALSNAVALVSVAAYALGARKYNTARDFPAKHASLLAKLVDLEEDAVEASPQRAIASGCKWLAESGRDADWRNFVTDMDSEAHGSSATIMRCVKLTAEKNGMTVGDLISVVSSYMTSEHTPMVEAGDAEAEAEAEIMSEDFAALPDLPTIALPEDASKLGLINLALGAADLPKLGEIVEGVNLMSGALNASKKVIEDLRAELKTATSAPALAPVAPMVWTSGEDVSKGGIPDGRVTFKPAHEVFEIDGKGKDTFRFQVPVWEWDGQHPDVASVNENYVFRPFELFRVLTAIIANKRMYLHGDTGSGKTTMIEQVAARLCWPFVRLNMDSDITRDMLIGKDELKVDPETGATVSVFLEGLLVKMISGPVIGCADEFDFGRSDIMYAMQSVLEGNGLRILEDGGRIVRPHPMSRLFATGNTVGQGDEKGMYQGARQQSLALLDRFERWMHVDYLGEADRMKLIEKAAPDLDADLKRKVGKYVTEHIQAFRDATVLQPITPRGYMDLAELLHVYVSYWPKASRAEAVREAVATSVLDRATQQDRVVLNGIAERVFG